MLASAEEPRDSRFIALPILAISNRRYKPIALSELRLMLCRHALQQGAPALHHGQITRNPTAFASADCLSS
jgi:hypothetical protein